MEKLVSSFSPETKKLSSTIKISSLISVNRFAKKIFTDFSKIKQNLVFGYINNNFSNEELQNKNLFIEVEKKKYPIEIINKPLKQTNFKNN